MINKISNTNLTNIIFNEHNMYIRILTTIVTANLNSKYQPICISIRKARAVLLSALSNSIFYTLR